MSTNAATKVATAPTKKLSAPTPFHRILDAPASPVSLWDNILPKRSTQVMPPTESKGLFIPWPLLAIMTTITIFVVSAVAALYIQVSTLNTTLLLRDADTRANEKIMKEKIDQLEVYIHDMREKRVADRADIEQLKDRTPAPIRLTRR